MATVGYARVSTADQDLSVQREELRQAGCERIFEEKASGASADSRASLQEALRWVRDGDVFVVTRIDRLARSLSDLKEIVDGLQAKGVGFRCLQQGSIDTTRSDGRLMLNILAAFAEWERDLIRERQRAGIDRAKAADATKPPEERVYRGRKPAVDPEKVWELLDAGRSYSQAAADLEVSESTVWRAAQKRPGFRPKA